MLNPYAYPYAYAYENESLTPMLMPMLTKPMFAFEPNAPRAAFANHRLRSRMKA